MQRFPVNRRLYYKVLTPLFQNIKLIHYENILQPILKLDQLPFGQFTRPAGVLVRRNRRDTRRVWNAVGDLSVQGACARCL